jgi:hypothetical protein
LRASKFSNIKIIKGTGTEIPELEHLYFSFAKAQNK